MSLYEEIIIRNQQKGEQIGIQKGEQIGIQKGEQIGQEKKTKEFALKLHDCGNPIEMIAEYVAIPIGKVNDILKNHNRIYLKIYIGSKS